MPIGLQGFQNGNKVGRQFEVGPRVLLVCPSCRKDFEVPKWDAQQGRKAYSRSCRLNLLHKNTSGGKHWNWKGGISNKWDSLHNSQEYKDWRMAVFRRDHFTCQTCSAPNSRSNKLHAHHIKTKKDFPGLILDVDNGMTVCSRCHINIHRGRHG